MNRKLLQLLPFLAFLPFFTQNLTAQTTCSYTIIMNDAYGDGWNGGILTVTTGTQSTQFTLVTGLADTMTFDVFDGLALKFAWAAGGFNAEVSYKILDNVGAVVSEASSPAMPPSGVLYTGIGDCVACSPPLNFKVNDVWDTYVKLRWSANPNSLNPAIQWRVIYGLQGFDVVGGAGDTATTTTPKITLTGLEKKTWYDAYIEQDCGVAGGLSQLIGPIAFQTYWTKDVGISGVVSPVSACTLGSADTVRILLKNYGSAPQSIVPFRYTVNGIEVNIPKPSDGVFSGVLGKDSVETIAFETTFDFSAPGEYKIVAYTKFTGDEDLNNDTFTYYLTNRLLSPYTQQFEEWDGGFEVVAGGDTPSFEYGIPNKTSIPSAANGQKAWVTSLTKPYNSDELTYLESPCFDFANLTVDPAINFSINHDLESEYDGAWLEVSVNDGNTWTKIGGINQGLNWYNEDIIDGTAAGESWSGSSGGWVTARHFLNGTAGESSVRFRFVFASDVTVQFGGLGIDDIYIAPAFNKDLAGSVVAISSEAEICGLPNEPVTFTFVNLGAQTQSNIQVAYAVNGGTPVVETVSGPIAPDETRSYTFNTTFDSRDAISVIKCWTMLAGEFVTTNDSAAYTIDHRPLPTPFQEDFEAASLPQDWISDGFVTNSHGNTSYVLATNLYSGNQESIHDSPRYGPIGANDSLEFSYRIVDYQNEEPFSLDEASTFELQVSTDCGETHQTLYTINSDNHTPIEGMQKIKVGLAQFEGKSITIRFLSSWGEGDFWFDIDNINLLSCAADMGLTATVNGASQGQSNGVATVNVAFGNPPYTYLWSTGATTQTVNTLAIGTYTVSVADAYGCSDSFEFSVGLSATVDMEGLSSFSLRPNPTSGAATFIAEFDRIVGDARLEVLNLLGQSVWETTTSNTTQFSEKIDLTPFPDGLYLVRLMVDGQMVTKKLIKG